MANHFISVVLSGGAGTRLWPVSREGYPKPFMRLPDGETLLEKTYARVKSLESKLLTVTNRDYYFLGKGELDKVGLLGSFLLEPFGRNTAPAIAMSAHWVTKESGSDTVMLVLPADHLIDNQVAFASAVKKAISLAENDFLVTFGIVPDRPETGYGYIERGEPLILGNRVQRFVEKPDLERARDYLASGKYLWNSGMFCFKASVLLDELKLFNPILSESIEACWNAVSVPVRADVVELPEDLFKEIPDISIDYALMERSQRVAVVASNFGWNDIGSWSAVRDLVGKDALGNSKLGDAVMIDSRNTFVQGRDRLVAALGVENLFIVDSQDALLVAHADKAQDVKKVVGLLKDMDHQTSRVYRSVQRPWGRYTILGEGPGFKIKRIEVNPGQSLSLQLHQKRSEHWVVVSGTAKVINGENETVILANQSAYIPKGQKHRLINPSKDICVMIEVQCGEYLGEDDIVRFDDQYSR